MHSLTIGTLKSRGERQKHQCQSKQSDVRKILLDTASFDGRGRTSNAQNVRTALAEKGNNNKTDFLEFQQKTTLILGWLVLQWTSGSSTVQQ